MAVLITRRAFGAAAAGAAALVLAGCERGGGVFGLAGESGAVPRARFNAIDITGANYGRELALPDADGRARTLADFRGKFVVLFFGFVHCPDVCPTKLMEIAEARRLLGPDGERVQGVFVTVDPERDTPEVLRAYMAKFDPSFIALRGNAEQTRQVAREFRVFYAKAPGPTPTSYSIDHTAGSYVIDAQGRLRLFTRYGSGAAVLAHDLRLLLAESPG